MKNIFLILTILLFYSCNNSDETEVISEELSLQEKQDLQFLKEEEKLARDVYLYAFDLYAYKVFENISKSEQMHMDLSFFLRKNTSGSLIIQMKSVIFKV